MSAIPRCAVAGHSRSLADLCSQCYRQHGPAAVGCHGELCDRSASDHALQQLPFGHDQRQSGARRSVRHRTRGNGRDFRKDTPAWVDLRVDRNGVPIWLQYVMQIISPTPHFVAFSQGVLYRGAGLTIVWPQIIAMLPIGSVYFAFSLRRFRRVIFGD